MWRVDSLEKTLMLGGIAGRRRRGRQRMRWLDGITDSMDMNLSELWGVGDGQGGLACCDSWGRKESDTTEWLNWTDYDDRLIKHEDFGCHINVALFMLWVVHGHESKNKGHNDHCKTCLFNRISMNWNCVVTINRRGNRKEVAGTGRKRCFTLFGTAHPLMWAPVLSTLARVCVCSDASLVSNSLWPHGL